MCDTQLKANQRLVTLWGQKFLEKKISLNKVLENWKKRGEGR